MITQGVQFIHPQWGLSEVIKYRDGLWICQQLRGFKWFFACSDEELNQYLQDKEEGATL